MMKKLIAILSLLTCVCMILCACNTVPSDTLTESDTIQNTESESDIKNESESETESEPVTDVALPDVVFFEPSKYVSQNFAIKDERAGLILSLPSEWKLKAVSAREYTITRGGSTVGKITNRDSGEVGWEAFSYEEQYIDGIDVTRTLEHKNGEFRYRYTYSYTHGDNERCFILTCNYSEVSDFTSNKLFVPKKDDFTTDGGFSLLEPYDSVLIIGNSFVGTSEIGTMLKNILYAGGKHCEVTAISIGHAMVSTYTSKSDLMGEIYRGKYDAVFMCGLYNADQVKEVGTLKRYCDNSGTDLIVFPAHNETRLVVQRVMQTYDGLTLIDWKGELDALIAMGVDRWDLCFDDAYDHSKPVAGYVGAHMIYRAMYGEVPPSIPTQKNINAILGDYAKTGTVQLTERSNVYVFIK